MATRVDSHLDRSRDRAELRTAIARYLRNAEAGRGRAFDRRIPRLVALLLLSCLIVLGVAGAAVAHPGVMRLSEPAGLRPVPDSAVAVSGHAPARVWLPVLGAHVADTGTWYRIRAGRATGWLPAAAGRLRDRLPRPNLPDCDRHRSRSIGSPGHGRLLHGVLFPATGPDHFAWNFRAQRIGGSDPTRWGQCRVVRAVLLGLAAYRERNPDAPPVAVGDMGLRHGGEIDGHSTHENGRQIDLYFPRRDRKRREPHTVAQVDKQLSRELVHAMLDAGADRVLIGPRIRIGTSARVIRWPNHDDHLHAMF